MTEPSGGSDVAGLRTTARRDGDHYVVNGAKTFITSGIRADFVTTAVRTGGEGYQGISLLVIDKGLPGFTVSQPLDKMGWRCSDTAELSFEDVRVPAANLVGEEGGGFLLIMRQFQSERLALATHAWATAQRCLDLTLQWVKDRETFGRPLSSRQVVRHQLAEMARQVWVAKTTTRAAYELWLDTGDAVTEVSMAKNTAARGVRPRRGRGGPAVRRAGLHAGVRGRAALPGQPDPADRRRHRRDHERGHRQADRALVAF